MSSDNADDLDPRTATQIADEAYAHGVATERVRARRRFRMVFVLWVGSAVAGWTVGRLWV